jgi:hypothetical protein
LVERGQALPTTWVKSKIARNTGIFLIGFAIATAIAFMTPMSFNKQLIYYPFSLLFIGYIGVDYFLESRRIRAASGSDDRGKQGESDAKGGNE